MHIFYIHGFLSGPNAMKATLLDQYIKGLSDEHLVFEALSFSDIPQIGFGQIVSKIDDFVSKNPQESIALIGSSLGGFYVSLLCARYRCKSVLLNPCVHPQDYFVHLSGPQYNSNTDCHFEVDQKMLDFMTEQDHNMVVRDEFMQVYLGTQDEVLDYRKSLVFYANCDILVVPGEDHAFSHNFKALIPSIMDFITQPL